MNFLVKAGCRVYQKVIYCVSPFLGWRKPQLLRYDNGVEGLPAFIKEKGYERVLLITDAQLTKLGLTKGLLDGLAAAGITVSVFDKTVPNPPIENVEEALALYRDNDCQAIIAFGGGSPMDCAKATGARVARPDKPVHKMKGILKVGHARAIPDLIAIPTTAGTGSETTLAAVICNAATHEKYAINDPVLIPRYAVLDPKLTVGLPPHITSTTGLDALTHAVEAYIGHSNTRETVNMAVKAVKLVFENLPAAYENGADLKARENMQLASFCAGVAFTRAYVGYVHAMAHTLGGFYQVPHGLANAIILPYVLEYYGASAHKRLAELARYVGLADVNLSDEENAAHFIGAIRDMRARMNIPDKIASIREEDLPVMVKRALAEANPLYPVPRILGRSDLETLFRAVTETIVPPTENSAQKRG